MSNLNNDDNFKYHGVSNERYLSAAQAKIHEIQDMGLDIYYGDAKSRKAQKAIREAYQYKRNDNYILVFALIYTRNPYYINLGRFLQQNLNLYNNAVEHEKAKVVLKKGNMLDIKDRTCITIGKQFEKIEKKAIKLNKKQEKKIGKFKGVKYFVNREMSTIIEELKNKGWTPDKIKSVSAAEVTEYFDAKREFDFLRYTKLTTKHI